MAFWIVSTGIVAVTGLVIVLGMVRARQNAPDAPVSGDTATDATKSDATKSDASETGAPETGAPETSAMAVYRAQLAELARDQERGVISAEDGERLRIEISRRLLAEDAGAKAPPQGAPVLVNRIAAAVVLVVLAGGTYGLYQKFGANGVADLPLVDRLAASQESYLNRPSQVEAEETTPEVKIDAEPDHVALVVRLREALETRPDDITGLRLLAQHEARLGNLVAARTAMGQVVAVQSIDVPQRDLVVLLELMVYAAGGYVSPEAEAIAALALQRDPSTPTARYYMGLMFAQNDRPDQTFRYWQPLVGQGPSNALWMATVERRIEEIAFLAGIKYQKPAPTAPDAEAMAALADLSPQERDEAIRNMVAQLDERLRDTGGTVAEWRRLINAYAVMGNRAALGQTITNALTAFEGDPAAAAAIQEAATEAQNVLAQSAPAEATE